MPTLCYPATRPIRVTEPTFVQEPLTLHECRDQLGLSGNDSHDSWIVTHLGVAREHVEHDAGVVCVTGSFTWKITEWPNGDSIPIYGARPVTAIASIAYVDTAGDSQTWSSAEYSLKTGSLVPSIYLGYGYVWPTIRGDQEGITITLTAGYATVAAVPAKIKAAVRLKLHELWQLHMGEDERRTVEGYERLINLIRRDDYA